MPGREVRRRESRPALELEPGDLDVRIVGTVQVAGDVAAMLRGRGVTVRGPYPRRNEPGRVSYYARLAAGEQLAAGAGTALPPGPTGPDGAP